MHLQLNLYKLKFRQYFKLRNQDAIIIWPSAQWLILLDLQFVFELQRDKKEGEKQSK